MSQRDFEDLLRSFQTAQGSHSGGNGSGSGFNIAPFRASGSGPSRSRSHGRGGHRAHPDNEPDKRLLYEDRHVEVYVLGKQYVLDYLSSRHSRIPQEFKEAFIDLSYDLRGIARPNSLTVLDGLLKNISETHSNTELRAKAADFDNAHGGDQEDLYEELVEGALRGPKPTGAAFRFEIENEDRYQESIESETHYGSVAFVEIVDPRSSEGRARGRHGGNRGGHDTGRHGSGRHGGRQSNYGNGSSGGYDPDAFARLSPDEQGEEFMRTFAQAMGGRSF